MLIINLHLLFIIAQLLIISPILLLIISPILLLISSLILLLMATHENWPQWGCVRAKPGWGGTAFTGKVKKDKKWKWKVRVKSENKNWKWKKGRNSIYRKSKNSVGAGLQNLSHRISSLRGAPPYPRCFLFCFLAWGESCNPPPPLPLAPLFTGLILWLGFWNPSFKSKVIHRKLKMHQKYPCSNHARSFELTHQRWVWQDKNLTERSVTSQVIPMASLAFEFVRNDKDATG